MNPYTPESAKETVMDLEDEILRYVYLLCE